MSQALALSVRDLSKTFGGGRSWSGQTLPSVKAVQNLSFDVPRGQTLGIVGESGCGKSTLARMLVGLLKPTSGQIHLLGEKVEHGRMSAADFGRRIQYVFQDPLSSLNPRKTVRQILEAPLKHLHAMPQAQRQERIAELMDAVNLRPEFLDRFPHEFSGGQAQRIGIARALAAQAQVLILDEPVSALDVSVQAQVLNLLEELKQRYDLTYLFISHDLSVVEAVSDTIAVLYFGRLVEQGPAQRVFSQPHHPYTQLLAGSAPQIGVSLQRPKQKSTELPDPLNPPAGCAFAGRCIYAKSDCGSQVPALTGLSAANETDKLACFHPLA